MNTIEVLGMSLADLVQVSAGFVGVLASVLGVTLSLVAEANRRRRVPPHSSQDASDRDQLELQIRDIRSYLGKQEQQTSANGVINLILNVSQYGVGAALVTSFVSENLTSQTLGILGVVTLLSSFSQQVVRPDVKQLAASRRAVRLQEVLRRAEIASAETRGGPEESQLRNEHARRFLAELHAVRLEDN